MLNFYGICVVLFCAVWGLFSHHIFVVIFPSTNGEGSLIISGRFPVAEGCLLLSEIKILLGLLHCGCYGSLDLGEIYQFRP